MWVVRLGTPCSAVRPVVMPVCSFTLLLSRSASQQQQYSQMKAKHLTLEATDVNKTEARDQDETVTSSFLSEPRLSKISRDRGKTEIFDFWFESRPRFSLAEIETFFENLHTV